MKKPNTLKLKDQNNQSKRSKGISSDFNDRKAQYNDLKELRQVLKEKKNKNVDKVIKFI
jgi:hypothetical protein